MFKAFLTAMFTAMMTGGVEFLDLLAAALMLAFVLKLLFLSNKADILNPSGNREKLSLLNQHIVSRPVFGR